MVLLRAELRTNEASAARPLLWLGNDGSTGDAIESLADDPTEPSRNTRRSGRMSSNSWLRWRATGAGLVVLLAFSTWAVAAGMLPPTAARAMTERVASAASATTRSDHETVARRLFDCVDPGHCGGITSSNGVAVRDRALAARAFAFRWAREWNRWAEAHVVPQQILRVGCRYLATERYYLCAVRVSLALARVSVDTASTPRISCGLIVVSAEQQAGPNDRIVNGLKTSCRIFATYPRQVVSLRRSRSRGWLELALFDRHSTGLLV